jgi:hypothetical protein
VRKLVIVVVTSLVAIAGAQTAQTAQAYSGTPNPAFADDGVLGLGKAEFGLVTARPDGVIVATTQKTTRDGLITTLTAVDAAGAAVTSFSGDGVASPHLPARFSLTAVVADANNRLLLLGGSKRQMLVRIDSDGTLDRNFGDDGVRLFGTRRDIAGGAVVDSQGRLVIVMTRLVPRRTNFRLDGVVTRLLPGGRVDESFGKSGVKVLDFVAADWFSLVDVDSQDRPVIVGGKTSGGPVRIVRLTDVGRFDSGFSGDGTTTVGYGPVAQPFATAVRADTSITVGGVLAEDGTMVAFRLDDAGVLDDSYGSGGKATIGVTKRQQVAATAIDDDGEVLGGGLHFTGRTTSSALVAGLLPDGSADLSIGAEGKALLPVSSGQVYAGPGVAANGSFYVLVSTDLSDARKVQYRFALVQL